MNTFPCETDARITEGSLNSSVSAWQYGVFMYSGLSRVLYCVGFGLVPHTAQCLIGRCSGSYCEELVTSRWQAAFVCRKKKKRWYQKSQRRLFAVGKQTLSSVVTRAVTTVAWQLAFIPWRCGDCSQCDSLLDVIHAPKAFAATLLWWRIRTAIPLQRCFGSTEWESIS